MVSLTRVTIAALNSHVKNLRHKLEDDPAKPQYILTVYGIGYKFTEEV